MRAIGVVFTMMLVAGLAWGDEGEAQQEARIEGVQEQVVQAAPTQEVQEQAAEGEDGEAGVRTIKGDPAVWQAYKRQQAAEAMQVRNRVAAMQEVRRGAMARAEEKTARQDANFMEPPARRYTMSFAPGDVRRVGVGGVQAIQAQHVREQRMQAQRNAASFVRAGISPHLARQSP